MDIKYSFVNNGELFIFRYTGVYSIEEHRSFSKYISQQAAWKKIEATLGDLRKAHVKISPAEVDKIVQIRKQYLSNGKAIAFLVDKPRNTAITHLYQDKLSDIGTSLSYCSTVFRATLLLNIDISESDLTAALNQLDQSFPVGDANTWIALDL